LACHTPAKSGNLTWNACAQPKSLTDRNNIVKRTKPGTKPKRKAVKRSAAKGPVRRRAPSKAPAARGGIDEALTAAVADLRAAASDLREAVESLRDFLTEREAEALEEEAAQEGGSGILIVTEEEKPED
jgi:hypothetical protein